jgi:hypothetical protein
MDIDVPATPVPAALAGLPEAPSVVEAAVPPEPIAAGEADIPLDATGVASPFGADGSPPSAVLVSVGPPD